MLKKTDEIGAGARQEGTMLKKIIPVEDAIAIIRDGDALATTGYGGNGTPDQLLVALEKRFLATGAPRDLTLIFAGGQGDAKDRGLNRLGHEGLVRRTIGGHYGLMPKLAALVAANKIEAYKDRKSTRLNSSHSQQSRMPSSA